MKKLTILFWTITFEEHPVTMLRKYICADEDIEIVVTTNKDKRPFRQALADMFKQIRHVIYR